MCPPRYSETLLLALAEATRKWDAEDYDGPDPLGSVLGRQGSDFGADEPERAASLVTQLCVASGTLPDRFGSDLTGRMIWYLMGAGRQIWLTVAAAPRDVAIEAVQSLDHLYDDLFARHLTDPRDGTPEVAHPLGTACYMLWDMDGGLTSMPMWKERSWLVVPCYAVLEHALATDSAACHLSALHGLGHLARYDHRPPQLIDAFLRRTGATLSDELRDYAAAAQEGMVQ